MDIVKDQRNHINIFYNYLKVVIKCNTCYKKMMDKISCYVYL